MTRYAAFLHVQKLRLIRKRYCSTSLRKIIIFLRFIGATCEAITVSCYIRVAQKFHVLRDFNMEIF